MERNSPIRCKASGLWPLALSLPILIFALARCVGPGALPADPRGEGYAGSAACLRCHANQTASHGHSAHARASAAFHAIPGPGYRSPDTSRSMMSGASRNKMPDSPMDTPSDSQLDSPLDTPFYFADSSFVRIETKNGIAFQALYVDGGRVRAEPFDIVFGSGEKAQTYAFWKGDTLFELPLSRYSAAAARASASRAFPDRDRASSAAGTSGDRDRAASKASPDRDRASSAARTSADHDRASSAAKWAVSPGFSGRRANFKRVLDSRCFECHGSYIKKDMIQTGSVSVAEVLDRNTIVFGIDCERCHGPAAQHVKFQQENPAIKTASFITPIKSLSRSQQLDLCAVCHSGNDQGTQRSLFDFAPGDTLSSYLIPDFGGIAANEPDVHGKQVQLLQRSACFQQSQMTCNSCHSQHRVVPPLSSYITICQSCHMTPRHSPATNIAASNCIDCHMPLQSSRVIQFNTGAGQQTIPYLIRTHRIAIYPPHPGDKAHQQ